MKRITQIELQKILEDHLKWIKCKDKGTRADLSYMDLYGMNLINADLRYANLKDTDLGGVNLNHADLHGANMRGTVLSYSDLHGANLKGAVLSYADLRYANLKDTDLSSAQLYHSNLGRANLSGAIMRGAVLSYADLRYANLKDTDLSSAQLYHSNLYEANLQNTSLYGANLEATNLMGADLKGTNFCNANLEGVKLDETERVRMGEILKDTILGYKKTLENKIITLEIPKGAIVFSINNKKCRTNKVKVVKCEGVQHSQYDVKFKYEEGKEIEVDNFDMMYNNECGAGIHFFKTRKEAEEYNFY